MRTVTYNENEWRLVPVVATEKMLRHGVHAGVHASPDPWCPKTWTAMLEAAPKPPVVKQSLTTEDSDFPECSGDPMSCPENEGYGCCNRKRHCADATQPTVEESLKVGEAVAWQFRSISNDGENKDWKECSKVFAWKLVGHVDFEVRELFAHPKRDAADAFRYRWLRDDHNGDLCAGHEQDDGYVHILDGRRLDEAIDEAMAAGCGEVG